MTRLVASVVVVQDGHVLLHRKRSGIWSLPGGIVEADESVAEAAVREGQEETGLDLCLERLVGVYSRGDDLHVVAFAASAIGGSLQIDEGEVWELRYFGLETLPDTLPPEMRMQIEATLAGAGGGMVWPEGTPWPLPSLRPKPLGET
jgi:ADP-ribose pyrophosphatase YjhB (NUDIX family)